MQKKILIIDDELELGETMQSFLSAEGYHTEYCGSAAEGKKLYSANPFHLVISDVMMPNEDGVDFYLNMKDTFEKNATRFIFMTGNSDSMSMHNAYDLGVDEFVLKPFDLTDLKTVVDLVLKKADPKNVGVQYYRVLLEEFIQTSTNRFDVYLNIDSHFMCLAKKGQELSDVRLQNYFKKGLKYIYLTAVDYSKYIDIQLAISTHVPLKPIEQAKKMKLYIHLTKTISTSAFSRHMDSEIFKKALICFENYSQISFEHAEIFRVLESMAKESEDLSVRGAQISFLSLAVAVHWKWTSPKILSKVAMAGLLCEVGLTITPELAVKNRSQFTADNAKQYEHHPILSYEILASIKDIPEEVLLVAQQHHEDEAGLGFPHQLAKNDLHPFSRLIHTVIEFYDNAENLKSKSDIKECLNILLGFRKKHVSHQVLKTLYIIFGFEVPSELSEVLLPFETSINS